MALIRGFQVTAYAGPDSILPFTVEDLHAWRDTSRWALGEQSTVSLLAQDSRHHLCHRDRGNLCEAIALVFTSGYLTPEVAFNRFRSVDLPLARELSMGWGDLVLGDSVSATNRSSASFCSLQLASRAHYWRRRESDRGLVGSPASTGLLSLAWPPGRRPYGMIRYEVVTSLRPGRQGDYLALVRTA